MPRRIGVFVNTSKKALTISITEKNGFVTPTKLGTTNNFFLLLHPKILLQQPNVLLIELNILLF